MEFKIVVPTKGRAQTMCTHKYVDNVIICPAESELAAYKEINPDCEYVAHPDSVVGMAAKRQWIYDKFKNVFMMDDDLKGFSRLTQKAGESAAVNSKLAYNLIQFSGNMAKMSGAYLFGFNSVQRPEHYSVHKPFKLSGIINGCAFGMVQGADKLKFNDQFTLGHEFYISGLNAYHYRKIFLDLRFTVIHNSFGDDTGGCANMRTLETEKKDLDLLIGFFGDAIKLKSDVDHKKGKHEFSKNFIIPF